MPKQTYITTPIYYVNGKPHAGHALTMLVCDIEKRYHRMLGHDTVFLTGTDENALKVLEAAQEVGEDPQAFVDRISQTFVEVARQLGIEYDIFYRTTSPQHFTAVQRLFQVLRDNGYVYLDKYEGWYDVSAETFVREAELVDGKSPDGNEVRWVSEENYFFKLSAFGDQLLAHADANPEFWLPVGRAAEVRSFIQQGLRDLCISRANPGWGVPVPGDDSKVIYVWFDALINYLAATGWPEPGWEDLWPADVHWMAKEIFTRFHATTWPAMLMAAGVPLPKTIIAHGWFTFNDAKMSKSKGNVVTVADLLTWFGEIGCSPEMARDAVRFALARVLPYDGDANFGREEIARHFNADLANDLGNALNRTINMVQKFCGGVVPAGTVEPAVVSAARESQTKAEHYFATHELHKALDSGLEIIRFLNRYIQEKAPWTLAKNEDAGLNDVIVSMLYCLRVAEGLLRPFVPSACDALLAQLGYAESDATTQWSSAADPARLNHGKSVQDPSPLFPRIDLKAMNSETPTPEPTPVAAPAPAPAETARPTIEFPDFAKIDLRVGRVLEAEAVENSEKLLKLQVLVGEERRQVIAGIKKSYEPDDLIGRQVILVMNLKPRKMAGLESQGMILAADGPDGKAILLTPEAEAPEGTAVH